MRDVLTRTLTAEGVIVRKPAHLCLWAFVSLPLLSVWAMLGG